MITELSISGVATYPAEPCALNDLKLINFLFGHNGSGKTTVSRALASPGALLGCDVRWHDGRRIETLVYNCDFVGANFGEQMQGIFTLGDGETRAAEEIARLRDQIDNLNQDVGRLNRSLDGSEDRPGRRAEHTATLEALRDACWASQRFHKDHFADALTPHRGNRTAFCDQVLAVHDPDIGPVQALDELKDRYATVFGSEAQREVRIAMPAFERLLEMESNPILSRQIVGRDDVLVAALIKRLGNSDWVREGMPYLEDADGACPFCQQDAPPDLLADLGAFFDESYERDLRLIRILAEEYEEEAQRVLGVLNGIIAMQSKFFDNERLTHLSNNLRAGTELNYGHLAAKIREPVLPVDLAALRENADALAALIGEANTAIAAQNALIDDLAVSREVLKADVWRYIAEERRTDIGTYLATSLTQRRAIEGMEHSLGEKQDRIRDARSDLTRIEAQTTSVQPTVNGINRLLDQYGFTSFGLAVAGDRGEMYKIVRSDGTDATATLSEGERSFVTFLYFYHLLAGSKTGSGTAEEKVVVFDDPVSSMDSEVLFIISALIRKIIDDVRNGTSSVRQVFSLTHNIYFHKEVSYDRDRRPDGCKADETFWVVRKRENVSSITNYAYNPVRTSYELLWEEVRNNERPNLTIQNTLRRIVEQYLVMLGGLKPNQIVAQFTGRDQMVCASFFSWINDGSHSAADGLYLAADDSAVESYLRVFEQVFVKTGHGDHYRMMMRRTDDVENVAAPVATLPIQPPTEPTTEGLEAISV